MFLCPPRNDIPHGREHISVPAKHLPLLCCPSSSLCHPAHRLMDGADGRGRLPDSSPTPPTHQRERGRQRDKETEGQPEKLLCPTSRHASKCLKDGSIKESQYQIKSAFFSMKREQGLLETHVSNSYCIFIYIGWHFLHMCMFIYVHSMSLCVCVLPSFFYCRKHRRHLVFILFNLPTQNNRLSFKDG